MAKKREATSEPELPTALDLYHLRLAEAEAYGRAAECHEAAAVCLGEAADLFTMHPATDDDEAAEAVRH